MIVACYNCGQYDELRDLLCAECFQKKERGEFVCIRAFPGTAGLSDGPNSGVNEMCFDRPKPVLEVTKAIQEMERNGQLNTPEARATAELRLERAKARQATMPPVDYQKDGHPLERE